MRADQEPTPSTKDGALASIQRIYIESLDAIRQWALRMDQLDIELLRGCGMDASAEHVLQLHPELAITPSALFERLCQFGISIAAAKSGGDAPKECSKVLLADWPAEMIGSGKVHRQTLLAQIAFASERSIEEACERVMSSSMLSNDGAAEGAANRILDALLAAGEEMIVLQEKGDATVFFLRIVRNHGDLPWHLPQSQIERLAGGADGFATLAAVEGSVGLSRAISGVADTLRTALQSSQNRYKSEDSWGQLGTFMVTLLRDSAEIRVMRSLGERFEEIVSRRARPISFLRR